MKKEIFSVNVGEVKVRDEQTRLAHFLPARAFRDRRKYSRKVKHKNALQDW